MILFMWLRISKGTKKLEGKWERKVEVVGLAERGSSFNFFRVMV